MRDKKELIGISVVLGVIWSTYIVVATLLKQNHDITFWICCGFVSIATVIQWSIDYKLLIHQMNLKDYFFDFPVIYISAFYLLVEIIAASVLMGIGATETVCFVIQSILLTIFIILFISGILQRTSLKQQDEQIERMTGYLRDMEYRVKTMVNLSDDSEVQKKLIKLSEEIRFSIPSSDIRISDINKEILQGLDDLEKNIKTGNIAETKIVIKQIFQLIEKRNEKAKKLK